MVTGERMLLRQQYEQWDTGELLARYRKGGLTEVAAEVLGEVLNERGIATDQRDRLAQELYEASGDAEQDRLASLASRWGAQVIDSVIALLSAAAVFLVLRSVNAAAAGAGLFSAWLGYNLLADGLPGGQSLGKRLLQIAVVDKASGQACKYLQSAARNALLLILGPIDWFFIFGVSRQRLGDRIAGTVVVKVTR